MLPDRRQTHSNVLLHHLTDIRVSDVAERDLRSQEQVPLQCRHAVHAVWPISWHLVECASRPRSSSFSNGAVRTRKRRLICYKMFPAFSTQASPQAATWHTCRTLWSALTSLTTWAIDPKQGFITTVLVLVPLRDLSIRYLLAVRVVLALRGLWPLDRNATFHCELSAQANCRPSWAPQVQERPHC